MWKPIWDVNEYINVKMTTAEIKSKTIILNMELVNVEHAVNVIDSICMLKEMFLLVILFVLSSLEPQMGGGYCTRTVNIMPLIYIKDFPVSVTKIYPHTYVYI